MPIRDLQEVQEESCLEHFSLRVKALNLRLEHSQLFLVLLKSAVIQQGIYYLLACRVSLTMTSAFALL